MSKPAQTFVEFCEACQDPDDSAEDYLNFHQLILALSEKQKVYNIAVLVAHEKVEELKTWATNYTLTLKDCTWREAKYSCLEIHVPNGLLCTMASFDPKYYCFQPPTPVGFTEFKG